MAVTRRGYIFGAFLLSVLSVLLVIVAVSSDSWVVATGTAPTHYRNSVIRYGLFRGTLEDNVLGTPVMNPIYMTCVSDINACAVSCKTEAQARILEVRALAARFRTNTGCTPMTTIIDGNLLEEPSIISFPFYICLLLIVFLQLLMTVITALLAIINATKNPTEPIFGLPGCLWSNVITALIGAASLLMFGVYWAVSGLQNHLAYSYTAVGDLQIVSVGLGFSYWILIGAIVFSLTNVGLIQLRAYLLERNPPEPSIKVQEHNTDGSNMILIGAIVCSLTNVGLIQLRTFLLERNPPETSYKVEEHNTDGTIFLY